MNYEARSAKRAAKVAYQTRRNAKRHAESMRTAARKQVAR